MAEYVIFHCNKWIPTDNTYQVDDFRKQKGVKALINKTHCAGCNGPAYSYCKMDAWDNLTSDIFQVCKNMKSVIEDELKTGKVVEIPKGDASDDKQTRGGLRASEYTMRITSGADNEQLHRYLNFLAGLEPLPTKGQQLQVG